MMIKYTKYIETQKCHYEPFILQINIKLKHQIHNITNNNNIKNKKHYFDNDTEIKNN